MTHFPKPADVVIITGNDDKHTLKREKGLNTLTRQMSDSVAIAGDIPAGSDMDTQITSQLTQARVILVMKSPDLDEYWCQKIDQVENAIRRGSGQRIVVVNWRSVTLTHLPPILVPEVPFAGLPETSRDLVWERVQSVLEQTLSTVSPRTVAFRDAPTQPAPFHKTHIGGHISPIPVVTSVIEKEVQRADELKAISSDIYNLTKRASRNGDFECPIYQLITEKDYDASPLGFLEVAQVMISRKRGDFSSLLEGKALDVYRIAQNEENGFEVEARLNSQNKLELVAIWDNEEVTKFPNSLAADLYSDSKEKLKLVEENSKRFIDGIKNAATEGEFEYSVANLTKGRYYDYERFQNEQALLEEIAKGGNTFCSKEKLADLLATPNGKTLIKALENIGPFMFEIRRNWATKNLELLAVWHGYAVDDIKDGNSFAVACHKLADEVSDATIAIKRRFSNLLLKDAGNGLTSAEIGRFNLGVDYTEKEFASPTHFKDALSKVGLKAIEAKSEAFKNLCRAIQHPRYELELPIKGEVDPQDPTVLILTTDWSSRGAKAGSFVEKLQRENRNFSRRQVEGQEATIEQTLGGILGQIDEYARRAETDPTHLTIQSLTTFNTSNLPQGYVSITQFLNEIKKRVDYGQDSMNSSYEKSMFAPFYTKIIQYIQEKKLTVVLKHIPQNGNMSERLEILVGPAKQVSIKLLLSSKDEATIYPKLESNLRALSKLRYLPVTKLHSDNDSDFQRRIDEVKNSTDPFHPTIISVALTTNLLIDVPKPYSILGKPDDSMHFIWFLAKECNRKDTAFDVETATPIRAKSLMDSSSSDSFSADLSIELYKLGTDIRKAPVIIL